MLQATDDPSLFVPASDVRKTGRRLAAFGRRIDDPQERLLAGLGRAARLHPPLDRMLHQAHPAELDFDVTGAYAFLREGAPVLAETRFGIQLPSWWQAGQEPGAHAARTDQRRNEDIGVKNRARHAPSPGTPSRLGWTRSTMTVRFSDGRQERLPVRPCELLNRCRSGS